jgi:hypothetical protein
MRTRCLLHFLPLVLAACERPAPVAAEPPALVRPDPLPPETDLPPLEEGEWTLACGATLRLVPGGRLSLEDAAGARLLGKEVVGLPALSADGRRVVFAHAPIARPETVISAVTCEGDAFGEVRLLVEGPGSPDRPTLSPDGRVVAWFSGATGIASLWTRPFEGGRPEQRTNVGLERFPRRPGRAPEGFVPPPRADAARFEALPSGGMRLVWEAAEGPQRLDLP